MATDADKKRVIEMWEAQSGFAKIIDATGLDIDTIVKIINDVIFHRSPVSQAVLSRAEKAARRLKAKQERKAKGGKP